MTLEKVFEQLQFSRLTNLVQAGGRLFVTEQTGRVLSFPINPEPSEAAVFLDIRGRVNDAGNEEGLLGLAFDPEFDANGHFYVYYSAAGPRRSVVSRFTADDSAAIIESELVVIEIPQPFKNHNGGQLAFGEQQFATQLVCAFKLRKDGQCAFDSRVRFIESPELYQRTG